MVMNPWDEGSFPGLTYSSKPPTLDMKSGFNVSMRSSSSEIQAFKFLCLATNRNGKSVCEDNNEETVAKITNTVYLDPP